jgi:protein-S-isoprenylcysteine O-methyltransferase Ste14
MISPTSHAPSLDLPALALRIPPAVVTIVAGLLGWIGAREFPNVNYESVAGAWLAVALVSFGSICSMLGVASFRFAHTTVNPMTPDAATALVVSGIYRITRNPMYLGFLLLLLAELVWLANPIALLVAPAFVLYLNRFQIAPEEQALMHRFGVPYTQYAARVRRWI